MSLRLAAWSLLIGGLLTACARKPPESVFDRAPGLNWPATPRVPSPDAASYAAGPDLPRDPPIYELLHGYQHDGSLAQGAAALALSIARGKTDLTRWSLREAAWRGGWPYPVDEARAWRSHQGAPPPRDLLTWLEDLPRDQPMSLVRARGRMEDVWIGITARPHVDLGALPRVTSLGAPLRLPAIEGGSYVVADPVGRMQKGLLDEPTRILLQRTGEWLFLIQRGSQEIARFPVYVDMPPPSESVLAVDDPSSIIEVEDAEDLTEQLLEQIRDAWDMPLWKRSPVFDAAARAYVNDPDRGSKGVLAAVGYEGVDGVAWACDDATVQDCLDQWLWDPRRRATLSSRAIDSYGLHIDIDTTGIHITLLLVDAR